MNLPDFTEMDKMAERAARARGRMKALERMEEIFGAAYMREAFENKERWVRNRPPTVAMLEKVYRKIGLTEEDKAHMEELAHQIAQAYEEYEEYSQKLQTARDKIAVWQTDSANKRKAVL